MTASIHSSPARLVILLTLFRRGAARADLLARIRQATEPGVGIVVCPLALLEERIAIDDLIDEVAGVRGAASLLAAGLEPGARFMVFQPECFMNCHCGRFFCCQHCGHAIDTLSDEAWPAHS